jgi:hypothetical protein
VTTANARVARVTAAVAAAAFCGERQAIRQPFETYRWRGLCTVACADILAAGLAFWPALAESAGACLRWQRWRVARAWLNALATCAANYRINQMAINVFTAHLRFLLLLRRALRVLPCRARCARRASGGARQKAAGAAQQ